MSELIKAVEARRRIEEMQNEAGRKAQEYAQKAIEASIEKGESAVSLSIDYKVQSSLKRWLETLGYKVECGNDQRDGVWFQVKW